MGTTTKGLPWPAATEPVAAGAAAIKALADALDFTRVVVLTAAEIPGPATSINAYPAGLSLLSLAASEAAAAGWPGAASCHVLTVKTTGARAAQLLFRNAAAYPPYMHYRQVVPDPGPHSAWTLLTPWTTSVAIPDVAASNVQNVAVTFPASLFTGTNPPIVSATPSGSTMLTAGLVSSPTAAGVTVFARNHHPSTAQSGCRVHVVAQGNY